MYGTNVKSVLVWIYQRHSLYKCIVRLYKLKCDGMSTWNRSLLLTYNLNKTLQIKSEPMNIHMISW